MSNFDYWLVGTFLVLFVINTWYQFRLGFSNGTRGGYAIGMYHAVFWLLKNKAIVADSGVPTRAADLVVHIMGNNPRNSIHSPGSEDLIKIAEASTKMHKE